VDTSISSLLFCLEDDFIVQHGLYAEKLTNSTAHRPLPAGNQPDAEGIGAAGEFMLFWNIH
jgi:hypothetical protein